MASPAQAYEGSYDEKHWVGHDHGKFGTAYGNYMGFNQPKYNWSDMLDKDSSQHQTIVGYKVIA